MKVPVCVRGFKSQCDRVCLGRSFSADSVGKGHNIYRLKKRLRSLSLFRYRITRIGAGVAQQIGRIAKKK